MTICGYRGLTLKLYIVLTAQRVRDPNCHTIYSRVNCICSFIDPTVVRYEQIVKLDLINIKKNFCALKDTTKKVERQPMEREKIFANHISDKELVFKIF